MNKGKLSMVMVIIFSVVVILSITPFAAGDVGITVDGTKLTVDVAPVAESGRVLVPVRSITEALGAVVDWDSGSRKATITTADNKIELTIDSKEAEVNGRTVTLDVPAKIKNGRVLIPLRFVGENLNAEVEYSKTTNTVSVKYFSKMSGTLKIGGSTTVQPVAQAAADALGKMNSGISISVTGGGSGKGITGVASGEFNIGNASKELNDSEKAKYPGLESILIGKDAIAIIVNNVNKVKNLTKQQVHDIFTGKITNWKDVGGDNAPIFVQTREPGSGTLAGFEELALEKEKVVGTATPNSSNGLVKQAVALNKNAIGFISFGYIDVEMCKAVNIEDIEPLASNASSGKWPYVRPLNVLTKGAPTGTTAIFINYLRSTQGQKIVKDLDYLPLR